MSSTKETKKEYEERLFNTKPKKLSADELADLVIFITKNGKGKEKTARKEGPWTIYRSALHARLKALSLKDYAPWVSGFGSALKALGHYPTEALEELTDKKLTKLYNAHLAEHPIVVPDKKVKTTVPTKASDSDSDSDSEDEAPKPKVSAQAPNKAKVSAQAPNKAALSESESEEEKPKPKVSAQAPNKAKVSAQAPNKAKVESESESEEEKPKPKPKPKAKVSLPEEGKTKVQTINGTKYFTANTDGKLWVYKLNEEGGAGDAVGLYSFETKAIITEEDEDEEEEEEEKEEEA
jgi:hypothetical protein